MASYLEHANITVPDVEAAIRFLKTIDPTFRIRHDEKPPGSHRWVHIGTEESYFALQEPHLDSSPEDKRRPYRDIGVNHLGLVVDDLEQVVRRLEENGYRKGIDGEENPHRKRAYYYDSANFEWELVQYLTDDPTKRNAYS